MAQESPPDQEDVRALKREPDRTSAMIEDLVSRWVGIIRRAAARYRLAGPDVDELTQDVRLRLWRALEREGPPVSVTPGYVYRAAASAAIDLVRRGRLDRSARRVPIEVVQDELAAPVTDVFESDLLEAVERAIAAIPPSRRPAVRLHLSGRHLDEIAAIMGWSSAKARNLLYRGLADLREQLGEVHSRGE